MEVKKVFIISSADKTKEHILQDLVEEGFNYAYKFECDLKDSAEIKSFVDDADEIWLYGDVKTSPTYVYALSVGADIWQMA